MSKKQKISLGMGEDEGIAKLLREIADALDGADPRDDLKGLPKDFYELKIKLKGKGDRKSLEVKVKSSHHPARAANKGGKKEFKALKKRMAKSFAAIVKAANAGKVPDEKNLHSFLAGSAAMTAIPGHGDKKYPGYKAACAKLAEACAKADLPAVKEAVKALADLKKNCHAKYK